MVIKYRAVHAQRPWRRVGIHKTVHSAVDGPDGAKRLLRRIGRVAKKWQEYGDVVAVFVWDENAPSGHAFRLKPGTTDSVETQSVPTKALEAFDVANGCSLIDIEEFFTSRTEPSPLTLASDAPSLQLSVGALGTEETPEEVLVDIPYPDELSGDSRSHFEGLAHPVIVNSYERSLTARVACLAHYGLKCQVCKLDFGRRYGDLGHGFIHVHHCTPISSIGREYRIDPVADLVPVCPNCHAMLHRRDPPFTIEELKSHLLHDG